MKVILILLVTCELCWTIRVPVIWNESESEELKQQDNKKNDDEFSVETFKPQNAPGEAVKPQEIPIPVEYFEYTAKKPQFAIDVAAFHGVQSPKEHYKAYPIKPYTERVRPELGKHHIFDSENILHKPFQDYTKINEDEVQAAPPISSSYEVFHPYEAEIPALQEIYKDPVLMKIRTDLENSRSRLQQYEKDAGEPDITKDEYLESPQNTDGKLFPQRHRPAPFEIHRPQRRPVYYRPAPVYKSREQYLNHKLRHPWNHNIAKVRPMHYRPIQNYIHKLRQNHALKYDDERNEYPQVQTLENYSDPKDGYDIYEKGRDKFVQLRNNVDESINKAVKENRPAASQKLEIQNNESASNDDEDDEEEFIPIKNYAQVRKTETFRHFPRTAALEDAETYDEIQNAPRLREAVKSTKAQTVYSEEGYEDAAYDHLGEQKHASENEGHGGFLKENEQSGGKYKIPSVSTAYEDGNGSVYKDQIIHAEKWKDDNKDTKEEKDEENYSEDEHEHLLEADNHQTEPLSDENHRNKRENSDKNETLSNSDNTSSNTVSSSTQHEVVKQDIKFEVPEVDFNSTLFKDTEFLRISKLKLMKKKSNIKQKYPYYFKNLKSISRNSPLRYAENLKFIPKKSKGGTEFYDSRSKFECPEVDDVPDPIPEKLKGDGHPDGESSEAGSSIKDDENFDTTKKQPRLKGLGDKIDCFKAKYFGENPLDSPFFKEDTIMNPEPVFLPDIAAYKLNSPSLPKRNEETASESESHNVFAKSLIGNTSDLFELIEKLRNDQNVLQNSTLKSNTDFISSLKIPSNNNNSNSSQVVDLPSVYNDVLSNIKNSFVSITPLNYINIPETLNNVNQSQSADNITYLHFQNKDDITKSPLSRKKRGAPFLYEPYKIIKDGQVQDDSKRTTATSHISPLIRQLQLSKVIDGATKLTSEEAQNVKRNINTRGYKNIGREDREIKYGASKNAKSFEDSEIVDVSFDKRRGEPRYEIKHVNHKSRYTPVTDKKSMSKADYDAQKYNDTVATSKSKGESSAVRPTRHKKQRENTYFNPSKFMPHKTEVHNTAASSAVRKTISTSTLSPVLDESSSDEEYEYYDEEEDDEKITTTSTTTTPKSAFRRMIRIKTTTQEPLGFLKEPRLKLVTRFRDYKTKDYNDREHPLRHRTEDNIENTTTKKIENPDESIAPKFREKKKKLTKSTLVTDTKKYGDVIDNDDEMMKEEVDALIGIKHDLDEYEPLYAKDEAKKFNEGALNEKVSKENKGADDDDDNDASDENSSYEDDENDDGEESDDGEENDDEEDEDEEDDLDDGNESAADKEEENTEQEPEATTPEPTKRTLVITTDAPIPTTASRSAKIQAQPIVTRKKIEIHKELPVNKSLPNFTQFKQDIKEIEIIKEMRNPLKTKPTKNVEVLDLYKDDNLAKDINKLGVEIFKQNLDLRQGPKHGGNYRSVERSNTVPSRAKPRHSKDDAEASQSENKKNIEFDDVLTGDDSKEQRVQKHRARNSKVIKLSDTTDTAIHGGNLRHRSKSRINNGRNQKLIELDEEHEDDYSREDDSYSSSKNERPMHGGNYRSAKLTDAKHTTEMTKARSKDARRNAALVLNSFVQAAPVLTTTPGYILDPSKRQYYYVDA